jgi:hypothetical protein
MMPPLDEHLCSSSFVDCETLGDLPFTRWSTEQSLDSAVECERVESIWQARGTKDFDRSQVNSYEKLTTSRSARLMLDVQHSSTQCIATDDPRLKKE